MSYFKNTGNRYADVGLSYLVAYTNKEADKLTIDDAKNIIGHIAEKVEEDETQSTLMGQVCPNNSILDVNSSIKRKIARKQFGKEYKGCSKTEKRQVKKEAMEHTKEKLNNLVDGLSPLADGGSCLGCGMRNAEERALRANIPLLGSKKFLNFFPNLDEGYPICKGCLFLTQLMPFALEKCGNMVLLFSDKPKIMEAWCKEKQNRYITMKALGKGGLNSFESNNYKSLIIEEIHHLISQYKDIENIRNPYIEVLYLNNYGTKQAISRLILPDKTFNFLVHTTKKAFRADWNKLIQKRNIKKDDKEYNLVYERMFQDKSISSLLYNRKEKEVICSWKLMKKYQNEVNNMNPEQCEVARKLGHGIGRLIVETERKKTLTDIERVKNMFELEKMFLQTAKHNLVRAPILTSYELEELHMEFENWHEIYVMIMYAIYEEVHEWYKLNYAKEDKKEEEE